MPIVTLRDPHTGSLARIAVDRGFNCYEFKAVVGTQTVEVLDSVADFEHGAGRPSGNGIPILFPYPNRIAGGRFQWAEQNYVLRADTVMFDKTGNAIHGLCIDRPWRVVEQTESTATGEFWLSKDAPDRVTCWPADCVIRIKYAVLGAKLRAEITISNPDSKPLPWGFGTHPYFKLPLASDSQATNCVVHAPAKDLWDLTECLPSGRRLPLPADLDLSQGLRFGTRPFDNGFGVVPSPKLCCSITDPSAGLRVQQTTPGHYPELVIFTPPNRNAICFEPYTCMTDAINLEATGIAAGWQTLAPGASFASWIDIEAHATPLGNSP